MARSGIGWLPVVAVVGAVGVGGYLIGHHGSATVTVTGPGIADAASETGTVYVGADQPRCRRASPTHYPKT
jgi:hypothetical protein